MSILLAMEGAISQGILWGLMTLGVYLTFRILNVADMTVDGSFAAGGAVTAILITKGMNPILSLLFVFITGKMLASMIVDKSVNKYNEYYEDRQKIREVQHKEDEERNLLDFIHPHPDWNSRMEHHLPQRRMEFDIMGCDVRWQLVDCLRVQRQRRSL